MAAPRQSPVNSVIDKWGFLIAALAGIGSIIALKFTHASQLLVTAAPLAVMAVYGVVVFFSRRFRLREDQSGDNLYYLGFLYTLTSLSFALWQGLGNPAKIIEDFGIALATTIFGLMLRVFFNQMRVDQNEIEASARLELTNAAEALRGELDKAVVDMNHFRRTTQQSLAEGLSELSKAAIDRMGEVADKFENAIGNATDGLKSALVAVGDHVRSLNSTSSNLVSEIETTIDRIRAMEIPQNLVAEKLGQAFDGLKAASDDVNNRVSAEEKTMKKLVKAAELAGNNADLWTSKVASLVDLMERAHQQMTASVEATTKATAAHQRLVDEMSQLRDGAAQVSLADLSAALSITVASVAKHNSDLDKELLQARGYTKQVAATLVDLSDQIVQRLGDDERTKGDT